ncbi:hypothetical protein LMH87_009396 [Akanthomyces muscarius]|uniref:Zn(2)-C6 fungal-type domain-containing protein n=1 Tax=Akanthomyces muscarius TaxID=2231603 RepID=A0A9W8UM73_AKAMU|nr:hypothetical protein LMH87_009396 [Akanthomyces muscarius]KAJ4152876.1 hypothetical protein LMH87_009396 [Akanthomyces muscarius]
MTRKSHKKSRNGCVECKRRHIKCDEAKPQCTNCVVVERTCEYAAIRRRKPSQAQQQRRDAPWKSVDHNTPQTQAAHTPGTISECAVPSDNVVATTVTTPGQGASTTPLPGHGHTSDPDTPINLHHMRLILHFSLSTAVPEIPDHLAKGGTELVLRLALETPYLLHQVLAVSARHLAHLHPDDFQFFYSQAIKFQTKAIEGFSASQPLGSDACMPAVLFSSILSRHSLVDTLNTRPRGFAEFLDSFVQCAQLYRGVRAVVAGVSWSSLLESELAPFLKWGMSNSDAVTHGHECDQLLRLLAITPGLDPVSRESCRTAVHHLQIGFDDLANRRPDKNPYRMLSTWNVFLPDEFVDLLGRHHPAAAAVMGWYAVLLHHGRHMWQVGDAGAFILASLVEFLGMEWSHWLEWPQSIIESES